MTGEATTKTRLLVVDDEPDIVRLLSFILEEEGHKVDQTTSAPEARNALARERYDLVLLDVTLGGADGREILRDIRRTSDVPVIMVSGHADENDRIEGLKLGADDYLVKPFSVGELVARVESVLRRSQASGASAAKGSPDLVAFGNLVIDLRSREVRRANELVELTAKEFDLLAFLARSPRQVFSRQQLLEQVWGAQWDWQDPATVTEHIRRVRRKLEGGSGRPSHIKTVHGVGYRFEP